MSPPIPHSSNAIRRQLRAVESLIDSKGHRRDALRMGPSSSQSQHELDLLEREIARLWQGKEYWQRQLEARLAWERAISGTPLPPPKQLPRGPDQPPSDPRFEVNGHDRSSPTVPERTWIPYMEPPFPHDEFRAPPSASEDERRCVEKWNQWRNNCERIWNNWMVDLRRWDVDMFHWDRQRRRAIQIGGFRPSPPPPKPEIKLPEPPDCPRPSGVYL
mgnify:CR=1 FL=1